MLHNTHYYEGHLLPCGNEPKIRDYLIPQILGFINTVDEGLKGRIQEAYILKSRTSKMFISAGSVTVYFRIEADSAYLTELTEDLRKRFGAHMENAGITARVVVYDNAWLEAPANVTFADAVRDNGLLVWSNHNDAEYMTAKDCIDSYYTQNIEHEHSDKDVFEKDALYRFLMEFPKLDWIHKNKAIMDRPVNYKCDVGDYVYSVMLHNIKISIYEYYLYTPAWVKAASALLDPFCLPPQPFDSDLERESL